MEFGCSFNNIVMLEFETMFDGAWNTSIVEGPRVM